MCLHKAGIAVRVDDETVRLYFLEKDDSHQKIRDHYKLSDSGALSMYQTPVEFVPVRGCEKIDQYDFVFDASRPDWWTDGMTEQCKHELFAASQKDLSGVWVNPLRLDRLQS